MEGEQTATTKIHVPRHLGGRISQGRVNSVTNLTRDTSVPMPKNSRGTEAQAHITAYFSPEPPKSSDSHCTPIKLIKHKN